MRIESVGRTGWMELPDFQIPDAGKIEWMTENRDREIRV